MSVITSQPQVSTPKEVLTSRDEKNQKENKPNTNKPQNKEEHKNSKNHNELKESRRRSISVFTFHANTSFDQPKKRTSSSSDRKSVSYPLNGNIKANNNVDTFTRRSSLDISKTRTKSISQSTSNRPSSRFFSSPQFSTSTPNLITKTSKYIDNELRTSHHSVRINETDFIIPTYVYKCIQYIKDNRPVEGLFRMNGSIKQINLLESELYKNVDSFSFNDDTTTSIHDVAVILKRWIAELDYGLITANVCNSLTESQKSYMNSAISDYPSDLEQDESNEAQNYLQSDTSSEIEIVDMDQNINFLESPVKKPISKSKSNLNLNMATIPTPDSTISNDDNTTVIRTEAKNKSLNLPTYKSIYSSSLSKLPIENLHLLLVLLDFLNYLSKPEISSVTKMHDLNLSKIFQLNIFKSIDLTINARSFSTNDLKSSYTTNEELLTSMINQSDMIIDDLSSFVEHQKPRIDDILNSKNISSSPIASPIASPNHKLSFSSNLFYKRRNNSTNSFTNTSTDFYSLTLSHSLENIPQNVFRSKDTTALLEPCIEKDILTNPSTPNIESNCPTFENLNNELSNENDVIIKHHTSVNELSSDTTQINESQIQLPNKKPSHSKRKSIFGIFNKRKSVVSDVKPNSDNEVNNSKSSIDTIESNPYPGKHHLSSTNSHSLDQRGQNKKLIDMKRQLQDLNPSEEVVTQQQQEQHTNDKTLTHHNNKTVYHHNNKTSTQNNPSDMNQLPIQNEKNTSHQRRFSLFKFKRTL